MSPPSPAWFRPTAIRPAAPRTLGLLAIVFGAVVACMNLLGVANGGRIGGSDDTLFSPEAVEVFNETTRAASLALGVVMVLMSTTLVLIGIGLRRYERWALRASVRWSLGALALVGVLAYVNAAVFDTLYTVYDLGPVPGVPNPLGGAVVDASDPSSLLIAGASERPEGAIYRIGLTRDACGHIIGWNGTATLVANTPYVDANLLYVRSDLLLYTEWPQYTLSQLPTGASTPARRTDLRTVGLPTAGDQGPGGVGLVPPGLAAAGELRLVTWPAGAWVHAATAPSGALLDITAVTQHATVPNNPGGFAYVPAGSPGFAAQSIIVAEWRTSGTADDRVAVYQADAQGDPIVSTRREFMSSFPRPWGAYFEPITGDYLFLSWGLGTDRVYVVQGFVPPPPVG